MSLGKLSLDGLSVDDLFALKGMVEDKIKTQISRQQKDLAEKMAQLSQPGKAMGRIRAALSGAVDGRSIVTAKYRHPRDPSITWSGRGKYPLWLQDEMKKGAKPADFLIKAKASGKKAGEVGRRPR